MTPKFTYHEGECTITSLHLAEILGRHHGKVLFDIRECTRNLQADKIYFMCGEYMGNNGKSLPMYYITLDGFVALVSMSQLKDRIDDVLSIIHAFIKRSEKDRGVMGFLRRLFY